MVAPGETCFFRKASRVAALKSGMTSMRTRPDACPRFSTPTRTKAAFLPLSWRLPRNPAWVPPIHVSSTSTSPRSRLPAGIHHGAPELVEHHPSRLIVAQSQLTLQEQRGEATLVRGHQIRRPEPDGQRSLRPVQDRLGRHRSLMPTTGTLPELNRTNHVRLTVAATRTGEAIRPSAPAQILPASVFGRELSLELLQGLGERRSGHAPTLPVGAC